VAQPVRASKPAANAARSNAPTGRDAASEIFDNGNLLVCVSVF
jgi:hypothetical protein